MARKSKNNFAKVVLILTVVLVLFIFTLMQAGSEEGLTKYTDLEKEEIDDDEESQDALREYYGDVLGYVKTNATFNTIAKKDELAVLNVTINGKDRRIFTRLRTATIFPSQDIINAKLIRTENLVVLDNISLKGIIFSEIDGIFGSRRLFDVKSTGLRYVDEGFSRLVNGEARVSINPILRELIYGYNVFLSAEGLTKGIYVAEKTDSYFIVKGVNPNSNVGFSWMLRGLKKDFDEKLESGYGNEKGITIIATINFEAGITNVSISGLDRIFALINSSINNNTINYSDNNFINNENNNLNNNQDIKLITGNLIDEFGLETDLGQILSEKSTLNLSNITEGTISNETILTNYTQEIIIINETQENITVINETIQEINELNETIFKLSFTLYSTDEDFIVNEVSNVTGLSLRDVKKLINFVYAEPENFADEVIEPELSLDFIEKVNGSVIIRLG